MMCSCGCRNCPNCRCHKRIMRGYALEIVDESESGLCDIKLVSLTNVLSLIKQYAIEYPSIKITLTKETHHA